MVPIEILNVKKLLVFNAEKKLKNFLVVAKESAKVYYVNLHLPFEG
jgi:hypothetical protein